MTKPLKSATSFLAKRMTGRERLYGWEMSSVCARQETPTRLSIAETSLWRPDIKQSQLIEELWLVWSEPQALKPFYSINALLRHIPLQASKDACQEKERRKRFLEWNFLKWRCSIRFEVVWYERKMIVEVTEFKNKSQSIVRWIILAIFTGKVIKFKVMRTFKIWRRFFSYILKYLRMELLVSRFILQTLQMFWSIRSMITFRNEKRDTFHIQWGVPQRTMLGLPILNTFRSDLKMALINSTRWNTWNRKSRSSPPLRR